MRGFYHMFRTGRYSVPESNKRICILSHLHISFEASRFSIQIPISRHIYYFIAMLFCIAFSKSICAASHATNNFNIVVNVFQKTIKTF